jgi:glycosyltransferase involved in cell wall biosynthesis
MPLVSILVPAYNGERFLGVALESALAQTHREIEVIVGDDGSTDATLALARSFAARDGRVRVLEAERNLGAPANQVRLHHAAAGAFVKPLLQDDVLAPDAVQRLLAPLLQDDAIVLATSKRGLIDEHGAALPDVPWTRALVSQDAVLDGTSLGDAMLTGTANLVGEVTTALYRAGVVAPDGLWHLGGEEYRANGDIALWLKLLAGGKAFYTPAELSWFRQHAQQASQDAEVILGGQLEWARLALEARTYGFLSDPAHEEAALVRAAQVAGQGLPAAVARPDVLDTLTGALSRLLARVDQLQAVAS